MPSGRLITSFQHNSFSGSVSIIPRITAHVQQSHVWVLYALVLIQVFDFKKLSQQISFATEYGEFNPASQGGNVATTSSILEAWGQTEGMPAAVLWHFMMTSHSCGTEEECPASLRFIRWISSTDRPLCCKQRCCLYTTCPVRTIYFCGLNSWFRNNI